MGDWTMKGSPRASHGSTTWPPSAPPTPGGSALRHDTGLGVVLTMTLLMLLCVVCVFTTVTFQRLARSVLQRTLVLEEREMKRKKAARENEAVARVSPTVEVPRPLSWSLGRGERV